MERKHSGIPPEPSQRLFETVMRRIELEKRRIARRRFAFFSFMLTVSMVGLIPAFQLVQSSFARSGSLELFSLIFSDFGTVSAYWRGFSLALIESLPVVSIAVFLAAIFAFMYSFRLFLLDFKIVHSPLSAN